VLAGGKGVSWRGPGYMWGEMTQILYAHMNKKKKDNVLDTKK
jgi:hypothetical protein